MRAVYVQLPDKRVLTMPIKTADDTVVGVIQAISCMQGSPTGGDAPVCSSTTNSSSSAGSSSNNIVNANTTAASSITAGTSTTAGAGAASGTTAGVAAGIGAVHTHTHHHHSSSSSAAATTGTGAVTAGVAAERRGSGTSSSSSRSSRSGSSGCSAVGFSEEDEITLQHIAELVGAALHTHRLAQETFTTNRRLEVSHSLRTYVLQYPLEYATSCIGC
jgi:hypothetical protein